MHKTRGIFSTKNHLLVEKTQELAFAQTSWTPALIDTFSSNTLGWPIGIHGDDYLATSTRISDGKSPQRKLA
jgi:hypothetical protein